MTDRRIIDAMILVLEAAQADGLTLADVIEQSRAVMPSEQPASKVCRPEPTSPPELEPVTVTYNNDPDSLIRKETFYGDDSKIAETWRRLLYLHWSGHRSRRQSP